MPSSEAPRCQHTKTNGTRCGSPALKNNLFCYYHQHCHPVAWDYQCGSYVNCSRSELTLPPFEDAESIQVVLRKVVELVLQHRIGEKEAKLVLYALQLASNNLKRLQPSAPKPEEIVTEPPFDPVREFREEEERHRLANEAFLEMAGVKPRVPKPASVPQSAPVQTQNLVQAQNHDSANPNSQPDTNPTSQSDSANDLPPGTIHACVAEASLQNRSRPSAALDAGGRDQSGRLEAYCGGGAPALGLRFAKNMCSGPGKN